MEEQYDYEREAVKQCVLGKLRRHFGRTPKEATPLQLYKAVSMAVRDEIMDYWQSAMRRAEENKSKVLGQRRSGTACRLLYGFSGVNGAARHGLRYTLRLRPFPSKDCGRTANRNAG